MHTKLHPLNTYGVVVAAVLSASVFFLKLVSSLWISFTSCFWPSCCQHHPLGLSALSHMLLVMAVHHHNIVTFNLKEAYSDSK